MKRSLSTLAASLLLSSCHCRAPETDTQQKPTSTAGESGESGESGDTAETTTACPPLLPAPSRGGDASADAAAASAWFTSVSAPPLTSDQETTGAAWVDLNRDGNLDVVVTRDDTMSLLLGDGCFGFQPLPFTVLPPLGGGLGAPMAVDFDHDGLLDLYLPSEGVFDHSKLLLADGAIDRYTDVAIEMGVDNPGAYVRGGASIGDLDRDGWFDFALGGHQIGHGGILGRPLSRLYVYRPAGGDYRSGTFEDLGGSAAAPGFGGISSSPCQPGLEATGLDATLHDLDDDGILDLLWATHNDMYATTPSFECITALNPYGLRMWRGTSATDVALVEVEEGPGSLVDRGRMQRDDTLGYYVVATEGPEPLGPALGPELLTLFDPDRDGDLDVLAVGPTDSDWGVTSDKTVHGQPGRATAFFRNDGGAWSDQTVSSGLDVIDQTIGQWGSFFQSPIPATSPVMTNVCAIGAQRPLCEDITVDERLPYPGQLLPLDADNDGAVDLLYVVRQCVYDVSISDDDLRSVLLHNKGDGTYEPLVTEISGVVGCGLGAFAEDIDNDGWLDLHMLLRDELQTHTSTADVVMRNLGASLPHGSNHWAKVHLNGRPEEETIGARITARDANGQVITTGWYEREAWRGSRDPDVHLGLGVNEIVDIEVRLRDGSVYTFADQSTDRTLTLVLSP